MSDNSTGEKTDPSDESPVIEEPREESKKDKEQAAKSIKDSNNKTSEKSYGKRLREWWINRPRLR